MKTVNLSLLAIVIAAPCAPSAFAVSHGAAIFMDDYQEMGARPDVAAEWNDLSYNQQQEVIAANPGFIHETRFEAKEETLSPAPATTPTQDQLRARFAQLKQQQIKNGLLMRVDNIHRTASQHADPVAAQMALSELEQAARDNGQDAAINDAHATASQAMQKANSAQSYAETVHNQVMVLGGDVDTNTAAIADNATHIKTTQEDVATVKGDVSTLKDDVSTNTTNIETVKADSAHANNNANIALMNGVKLSGEVVKNKADIAATQKTVDSIGDVQTANRYQGMINAKHAAEQESSERAGAAQDLKIEALSANVDAVSKPVATEDHTKELKKIHGDISKTNKTVSNLENRQNIDSVYYSEQIQHLAKDSGATQKRVADNTASINKLNSNFSSLKNEVDDNRKDANAGTASAIAFASQPQVKDGDTMMVSAGAGTFNGQSAVSVGASFNAGAHTVIKAGVTADTQSDFGAGAGIGYSF